MKQDCKIKRRTRLIHRKEIVKERIRLICVLLYFTVILDFNRGIIVEADSERKGKEKESASIIPDIKIICGL